VFSTLPYTYTLQYEYYLSGSLKKITDPNGNSFNYGRDKLGRLTNVSGPIIYYGQNADYISNIQYRAWGDIKSAEYPYAGRANCSSAKVQQEYDNRLRVSHYELYQYGGQYCNAGYLINRNYSYYNDGQLSATTVPFTNYIESYKYDSMSRLEQYGVGSTTQPQTSWNLITHTQDVWGNILTRQLHNFGLPFGQPDQNETYSYVNNRVTTWQYDNDGRITNNSRTGYSYNLAGQVATTNVPNEYTMSRDMDGDGLVVKQQVSNSETPQIYFIRSSVLGGSVLTEINNQGLKIRTYIYAFGKVIAKHITRFAGSSFQFQDPSGTTFIDTESAYYSHRVMSIDPSTGAVLSDNDWTPPEPMGGGYLDTWSRPDFESPFGGAPYYGGNLCRMDGFEANCAEVAHRLGNGSADPCPDNNCGPRSYLGPDGKGYVRTLTRDANAGELGYWVPQFNASTARVVEGDVIDDAKDSGPTWAGDLWVAEQPQTDIAKELLKRWFELQRNKPIEVGEVRLGTEITPRQLSRFATKEELDWLQTYLEKWLADKNCGEFINLLLQALPGKSNFTTKFSGSLLDLFKKYRQESRFLVQDLTGKNLAAHGYDRNGSSITGEDNTKIGIHMVYAAYITSASFIKRYEIANILVHELTHLFVKFSPDGGYGHLQMATAARSAVQKMGVNVRKTPSFNRNDYSSDADFDSAMERYFSDAIEAVCLYVLR
jgi:hypothetical protein